MKKPPVPKHWGPRQIDRRREGGINPRKHPVFCGFMFTVTQHTERDYGGVDTISDACQFERDTDI